MPYRLKPGQPEFDVVDGELAGRSFRHGREYAEIPEIYRNRFEAAAASEPAPAPPRPARKGKE